VEFLQLSEKVVSQGPLKIGDRDWHFTHQEVWD
jgi:hypothetical protein